MNKLLRTGIMCIGLLAGAASTQVIDTLHDDDVNAGDTVTLYRDTTYILKGKVFVESGAVLKIQAGTIIKGALGSVENASALVICRGGRIYANGTKYNPIILTAASDNFGNLTSSDKGLWGGLVILGNAVTNEGTDVVEGIATGDPRAEFGGDDDDDTSGVLRFVSIRHSGVKLFDNNELNGLSLAAVGRGTVIEHVEAYASSDDGFEWWGGTVECKHLIAAFCDDDAFDIDQGFRGKGQFWFSIQDSIADGMSANHAGEWDGDDTKGATPYGLPIIANATFIGGGQSAQTKNNGILITANGSAKVYNSIFCDFKLPRALTIHNAKDTAAQDSWKRFLAGDIKFLNNIFYNFGGKSSIDSIMWVDTGANNYLLSPALADSMEIWNNTGVNPELIQIGYAGDLNPCPGAYSPAFNDLASLPNDNFFQTVDFKGAFGNDNWAAFWTGLWDERILADVVTDKPETQLRDYDINEGEALTLFKDTVYILTEKIFVEENAVLTIEPGTVIKANNASSENAAALIICRGGKIIAKGTADKPIIFTSISDDVENPNDLTNLHKGLWGGVVILGNAVTNEGEDEVEGIAPGDPRSLFGGNDDADSSGILQYVSIRHSGISIANDNELNGLSLAGVGSKTIIDHVEIFASADDGIEWWGGTVNATHLIAAFCDDDAFDIDQGYRGKGQFWFSIQDSVAADISANYAGEWDGDDTKGATPYALPVIANATFIGGGNTANSKNAGIIFKANGAAKVFNSIFCNFKQPRAIMIEDKQDASAQDPYKRFQDGDIQFFNNIFYNFGGKSSIDSIMFTDTGSSAWKRSQVIADSMKHWNNAGVNPQLSSIGYTAGQNGLNPSPKSGSPAYSNFSDLPDNSFFKTVDYKGAFGTSNWADKWSFLDVAGYFSDDFVVPVKERFVSSKSNLRSSMTIAQRSNMLNIAYSLPQSGKVALNLFNLNGKLIAKLANGIREAGSHNVFADINRFASGSYICRFSVDGIAPINNLVTIKK